ncbi:transcriptional regulator [Nocardia thailandica]
MSAQQHQHDSGPDFAWRLNELFDRPTLPGRRPHTNRTVADAVTARGHRLSSPYLSQLRTGQRVNPSPRLVAALAAYFGVAPQYFYGLTGAHPVRADSTVVRRLRTPGLRSLLHHAQQLDADTLDVILQFSDSLRAAEGLPAHPDVH